MSDALPPLEELLAEFDSGKIPRSDTWQTLITGLYFNTDNVNEIEGWYNTVQELTNFNQTLGQTIKIQHDQIEIWYGQVDSWQQQVSANTLSAAESATTATDQATMAKAWASNPVDDVVENEQYSSLHYARQSSDSAANSSASADRAEASASQAKASETASVSSASLAQNSATSASNSASNALNSANNAQASETAAQQSASVAQASEQSAQDSAKLAGSSEAAAASSASASSQQADRSESEADRAKSEADRVIASSSRIVGEICRFSFDTPPPGFFALDGSTIPNGKIDFPTLASSGSRFITISGNNIVLQNFVDFGRGKGSSGRAVGASESDAIRNITGAHTDYYGTTLHGPFKGAFYGVKTTYRQGNGSTSGGQSLRFDASKVVPTANENRPKSLTELVCIYHGVI